jgi:hypothetical protein
MGPPKKGCAMMYYVLHHLERARIPHDQSKGLNWPQLFVKRSPQPLTPPTRQTTFSHPIKWRNDRIVQERYHPPQSWRSRAKRGSFLANIRPSQSRSSRHGARCFRRSTTTFSFPLQHSITLPSSLSSIAQQSPFPSAREAVHSMRALPSLRLASNHAPIVAFPASCPG